MTTTFQGQLGDEVVDSDFFLNCEIVEGEAFGHLMSSRFHYRIFPILSRNLEQIYEQWVQELE